MNHFKQKLAFFLLTISSITIANAQTWTTGQDIPEAFRASNVAAYKNANNGYLFLISGRNSSGIITSRNQRYDLTNNSWTDMANSPTGILGASTAIVKDSIYIIGGLTTTPGNAIRKVRRYSINENTWADKANFPVNIVDSDAISYQDSLIYVTAGYNSRVRVFNTITNQWSDATAMTSPLESIAWGALSLNNNKLIYMCGTNNFLSTNYFNTVRIGTIDQNNRANITWTLGTPFPGNTRTFFDAHPWQNGIIMTGGSTDNTFETNSNECYFYNIDNDTWTELPSKPTSWLTGNSASLLIDNQWKLICASGYNNSGYLLNTEIFSENSFLSIDDNGIKNNLSIIINPNPSNNLIEIISQIPIKEIFVHDLLGKKVPAIKVSNTTLDVSNLAQGMYVIKVIGENDKTFSTKYIKN